MAITFVTTASYGNWLPGDLRGFVRSGIVLPGDPQLLKLSRGQMRCEPVLFSKSEQDRLCKAIGAAADEFGYHLTDLAFESWHLHWITSHGEVLRRRDVWTIQDADATSVESGSNLDGGILW